MIFDWQWNTGLVVGIEQDEMFMMDGETEEVAEESSSAIYIHLGIISCVFIFV